MALAWAEAAHAQDEVDGAYGRLDGDLTFIGALGTAVEGGGPLFETHVALSYLSTAGVFARYTESFGTDGPLFDRTVAAGVELRPLFLGRYALNLEKGPAHLDLFADSFCLLAGAVWSAPAGERMDALPGLELGAGVEVPILPSGNGPYLGVQGLARWLGTDLDGRTDSDFLERGSMLVFTVSWHQIIDAGIVDFRDRRDDR
jgi:hypothetical protein